MSDPTRQARQQQTEQLPQLTEQFQQAPAQPTPQDAPLHPTTPPAASRSGPVPATSGVPEPASPSTREVRYLPRPTGPNWRLVLMGLAFVVVAAGVMANQVSGFRIGQLAGTGPGVLVGIGLLCALVGVVGMLRRRRH
jgi:hypothetical protein